METIYKNLEVLLKNAQDEADLIAISEIKDEIELLKSKKGLIQLVGKKRISKVVKEMSYLDYK